MTGSTRKLVAPVLAVLVVVLPAGVPTACGAASREAEAASPPISVAGAWSPDPSGGEARAVYLQLHNTGDTSDRLVAVHSDLGAAAGIHQTRSERGVMRMRPHAEGVVLAPGQRVSFQPGGWHVMLMGVKDELEAGDTFNIVLEFDKAGELPVPVLVRPVSTTF